MKKSIIFFILLLNAFCWAQEDHIIPAVEYRTVIPGEEYQAGAVYRLFFGDHWRDLWTTPITVPVIDLGQYAGGLTPIKTGGGFQTKSLHFKGVDGKFYKFRSINKDPSQVLPEDLRNSFAEDIVQDQISTSHPLSAVVVAPMLNAVGVLNAQPVIVILPDSPLLAEYRELYKDLLGTLEENPKDDTDDELIFAGAEKIKNDYDIFEELDENNKNQVDGPAYLKARLMDIFLGDWDRHVGQWKWARYDVGDYKIWDPIPRDRDQAFSRYDGFFPWIASLAVPQIEYFDENYPQINDLTWSGRHLDRRFLMTVDKTSWDSVTAFVQSHLTDDVIENAVRKMPDSWFALEGQNLIHALKKRRDNLPWAAQEYYEEISTYISIKTSDKDEYAQISRTGDGRVLVEIFDLDKKGQAKEHPFYKRLFDDASTSDIRVYMQGGNDKALVRGKVDESINVRVIGGSGADTLIDSSRVNGYLLYVLPLPDAENKTEFYDSDKGTQFVKAAGTLVDKEKVPEPKPYKEGDNVNEKYEPPLRDWGYDWKPGQWIDYNSYDGLQIGGGPILIRHDFRSNPYAWKMSLMYGYAFGPQSNRLEYKGQFYTLLKNWRVDVVAGKNELAYNHFYGLGNETQLDDKRDADFYQIFNELVYADISLNKMISNKVSFYFLSQIKSSDIKFHKNTIITTDDYKGIGKNNYLTLGTGLVFDTRDGNSNTRNGFWLQLNGSYMPKLWDNQQAYSKGVIDARYYYTMPWFPVTWSNRAYGEKIWGDYYIYDAAILGGADKLRGFTRERFAGDAALLLASEIRVSLVKLRIIIPGVLGLSTHAESGRVFYNKDESDIWHPAYGGSLWLSYLNEAITLNFTVSRSAEDLQFYFTTGFMF